MLQEKNPSNLVTISMVCLDSVGHWINEWKPKRGIINSILTKSDRLWRAMISQIMARI